MTCKSAYIGIYLQFLVVFAVFSQDAGIQSLIDHLLVISGEEINTEDLMDDLYDLLENPLNLNQVEREDLERLYFINDQTIDAILSYRESYGLFFSIYELRYVKGLTDEIINLLLPFIIVAPVAQEDKSIINSIRDSGINLLTRFSRRDILGANNPEKNSSDDFLGSVNQLFNRITLKDPSRLQLGLSFEKDAGERIFYDPSLNQYGFDHYSSYFMLENRRIVKKILFGDYKLCFGQGLIQGSGFYMGKGTEPVSGIMKRGYYLKPNTGSAEYGYLRGISGQIDLGDMKILLYSSYTKEDVSIIENRDSRKNILIKSVEQNGIHRTNDDLRYKDYLPCFIAGGNVDYNFKKSGLKVGGTFQYASYLYTIHPGSDVYSYFDFQGRSNLNCGLHFHYRYRNMMFFSEGALSVKRGKALVMGMIGNLSDNLEMTLLLRNYGKNYHSPGANGFGESSITRNEKGLYWGLKIYPVTNVRLDLYYDQYSFPWIKYQCYTPSEGQESFARVTCTLNRNSQIYFQFKRKVKEQNYKQDGKTWGFDLVTRNSFRINWSFNPESGIRISSRIQWGQNQWLNSFSEGLCFVQDLGWENEKFRFASRFALFDTEDYESRQYVYEHDVLYFFYIPAYAGKGFRNYMVIRYKPCRSIHTWIKVARTYYYDEMNEKEYQNAYSKWELRLQVQFKL